ncbi:hypothetical protein [Streptomyces sp. NPDC051173]|uniref:hypothetical protein n=1 Tax=Streptomyces sp. NPDC051173 TaxID=3155164 RepID=UPI0034509C7E
MAVETSGFEGGDGSQHAVTVTTPDYSGAVVFEPADDASGGTIRITGDDELDTMIAGLEWAARRLRELAGPSPA